MTFSNYILQSGGIASMTRTIYDLLGQMWVVETYGVWPAFGLLAGCIMLLSTVWIAVSARSSLSSGGGLLSLGGNATDDSTTDGVDDEVVTEAAKRIQQSGQEITEERLAEEIKSVKEDTQREQGGRTGVVRDREERARAAKLAISPERIVESQSYIKRMGGQGKEKYARSLIISSYPSRVSPGWLDALFTSGLSTNGAEVRVSYHIFPRDTEEMKQKLNTRATRLTSQIRRKKNTLSRSGSNDSASESTDANEVEL